MGVNVIVVVGDMPLPARYSHQFIFRVAFQVHYKLSKQICWARREKIITCCHSISGFVAPWADQRCRRQQHLSLSSVSTVLFTYSLLLNRYMRRRLE
ncbi:unnamed protein product [Linum trigynum]|uniref:Uncharacterized protein n=1 Tax=Linum trigynum TaxID=586398 RepID=A0AAV2CC84_9ROSI